MQKLTRKDKIIGTIVFIVIVGILVTMFGPKSPMKLISYNGYIQTKTTQDGKFVSESKWFYFYVTYNGDKNNDDMQYYMTAFMHYFDRNLIEATPDIWNQVKEGKLESEKVMPLIHSIMIKNCLEYSCYLVLVNDKSIVPDLIKLHHQNTDILQEKFSKKIIGYIPVIVKNNNFSFLQAHFYN